MCTSPAPRSSGRISANRVWSSKRLSISRPRSPCANSGWARMFWNPSTYRSRAEVVLLSEDSGDRTDHVRVGARLARAALKQRCGARAGERIREARRQPAKMLGRRWSPHFEDLLPHRAAFEDGHDQDTPLVDRDDLEMPKSRLPCGGTRLSRRHCGCPGDG